MSSVKSQEVQSEALGARKEGDVPGREWAADRSCSLLLFSEVLTPPQFGAACRFSAKRSSTGQAILLYAAGLGWPREGLAGERVERLAVTDANGSGRPR